jgi:hypothetical protein|tara:strand:+ start:444 stop:1277 length:834 start_codon:yes stop_codon:yes gene_type:complete
MDKEKKTNIYETKNYNKSLTANEHDILNSFCQLVNEYLFHITENIIIQNREYYIFIVLRGLHTLKHIFNVLLLYTKNLELTIYHAKKAYLFYVEFIGQIREDNNSYLQLNSKDATLFVYKKTIFEINNEYRKQFTLSNKDKVILDYVNTFTQVLIEIFEEVIDNTNYKGETRMSYMMYIQKTTNKITNKLIYLKQKPLDKISICKKYLHYKNLLKCKSVIIDECLFFNLSNLFFKKIQNNKKITLEKINKKMYNVECEKKLNTETPLKFTNWLFNSK